MWADDSTENRAWPYDHYERVMNGTSLYKCKSPINDFDVFMRYKPVSLCGDQVHMVTTHPAMRHDCIPQQAELRSQPTQTSWWPPGFYLPLPLLTNWTHWQTAMYLPLNLNGTVSVNTISSSNILSLRVSVNDWAHPDNVTCQLTWDWQLRSLSFTFSALHHYLFTLCCTMNIDEDKTCACERI